MRTTGIATEESVTVRSAGVAIILIALTVLWAFNTGRLQAILAVIKNPAPSPSVSVTPGASGPLAPLNPFGTGFNAVPIPNGSGGTTTLGGIFGSLFGGLFGGTPAFDAGNGDYQLGQFA